MDIKINAQGRYVEVNGIETDLEIAANTVYDLWAATELDSTQIKEVDNHISAGSSLYTDKNHRGIGFARFGEGERASVK
jgi:hypothetical protein